MQLIEAESYKIENNKGIEGINNSKSWIFPNTNKIGKSSWIREERAKINKEQERKPPQVTEKNAYWQQT